MLRRQEVIDFFYLFNLIKRVAPPPTNPISICGWIASFQDMNDFTDAMGNTNTALIPRRRPVSIPGTSMSIQVRGNDKIVTNAATFALYTVVVYLFGIVTSTFLTETGQATI